MGREGGGGGKPIIWVLSLSGCYMMVRNFKMSFGTRMDRGFRGDGHRTKLLLT